MDTKIKELEDKIKGYSQEYYFGSGSTISDEEFDNLVLELKMLAPDSEVLKDLNFGAKQVKDDRKLPHDFPVGGLPKAYSLPKDLTIYDMRITPKLDGVSCIAYYNKGKLVKILTRGNGVTGTNISGRLNNSQVPVELNLELTGAIRGELIMRNSVFDEKYSSNYKNPRNTVAGLVNSLNYSLEDVDVIFYDVYTSDGKLITYSNNDINLNNLIINKVSVESRFVNTTDELKELKSKFDSEYVDYNLDGIVCNPISDYRFAFKVNKEGVESEVVNITWNKSEYGKLVPVVNIEPVFIDGTTVSNVSGNSYDFLVRNQIQIGSVVKVIKSGEIIPYIVSVENETDFNVGNINLPSDTYLKGANLYQDVNDLDRYKKELIKMMAFVGLKGAGGSMLSKFAEYVISITDLSKDVIINPLVHTLLTSDKLPTKGFTPRELNFYRQLKEHDYTDKLVLLALSEEGVGISKINNELKDKDSPRYKLSEYLVNTYNLSREDISDNPNSIGISVVITGKLSAPRAQIEKDLKSKGVEISNVKSCDILICNDALGSQSSKIKTARQRGIPIYSESEFYEFLKSKITD